MPATYPLSDVRNHVNHAITNQGSTQVAFSLPHNSLDEVVKAFKKKGKPVTQTQARDYVFTSILQLTPKDFFRTLGYRFGALNQFIVVDEYGMRKDGIPWYIKYKIDPEDKALNLQACLDQISFHPLDKDMKLASNVTLSKEWDKT